MASYVLKNAKVLLSGGQDVSTWCRSVRINTTVANPDTTCFGTLWHASIGGLLDFSVDFEFLSDFAASIDALFFPKMGESISVDIRADSAATSTINPAWKGNVIVGAYAPIGASIGGLATHTVTCAGNGALTRTVA